MQLRFSRDHGEKREKEWSGRLEIENRLRVKEILHCKWKLLPESFDLLKLPVSASIYEPLQKSLNRSKRDLQVHHASDSSL